MSRSAVSAGTLAVLALAAPPLAGCAPLADAPARGRRPVADDARLAQLEALLAANTSATAALERWCAAQGIAREPKVTATTLLAAELLPASSGTDAELAPPALRETLGVAGSEPIGFRHVRLECGGTVLSEAYNWYVPALLTPEMRAALDTTRTPFGKVVAPLGYRREMLEARRGVAEGCPAGVILSHRAMLRLPDGTPLALLVECYTAGNLGD